MGRGGFGAVYAARHRLMGRAVAVKVLLDHGGQSDPFVGSGDTGGDLRTRFLAEARVLAELDHPHIVRVYDYVEHAGLCLLVMEQLTGGSLRTRMATLPPARGSAGPPSGPPTPSPSVPLDPRAACAIGLTAATALAAAHRIGVLHRDIKPDNLLFGADGMPRVADFGIAKIVEATTVTTTGLIGTPRYMAPEQIEGARLGPGTDLYALGTVLYELLTGRSVFGRGLTVPSLLHHHLSVPPDPMPEVPGPLAAVVLAALAKNPADRPASAHDLALMLATGATAVFGPGWLAATGVPARLPDDVLTAAGHRLGDLLPGMAPGWAPPETPPPFDGAATPSSFTPYSAEPDAGLAGDPARATRVLPEGAGWSSPMTPPYPLHTPRPGGTPPPGPASPPLTPTRLTPTRRSRRDQRRGPRRRGLLIGAGAALVVVLLVVGLVLGLKAGGGGGGARSGYAGQQLVLDRGSDLGALALRRDGTIYLGVAGSATGSGAVYEITTKGVLRSVAGVGPPPAGATTAPTTRTTSPPPVPVSGMAASQLVLDDPRAVVAAPDGTVYIADHRADRVYRITPDGRAFVFAGVSDDEDGFTADSGLATKASLNEPAALALGPDGSVYLAEGTRVRKITKDGLISTVAGAYQRGDVEHLGDGGPATKATLPSPSGLALAADGSVYVADDYQDTVREIGSDGIIRTIAGLSGQDGATGDGGPAAKALLDQPGSLALGSDGSLYIADAGNSKIRRVGRDGVITTVAGASSGVSSGLDGTVATEAALRSLHSVAVDPSGALYATLGLYGTLVRVDPANHVVRTLLAPPKS